MSTPFEKSIYIQAGHAWIDNELRADIGILVEDGRIEAVGDTANLGPPAGIPHINAPTSIITPGYIDLQLNGAFGHDFTLNPNTIWAVGAQLPASGVTTFLPTIITATEGTIPKAQAALMAGRPADYAGALPLGLHLEGPFLNPERKGAHRAEYMRVPSAAQVANWTPENGVRFVTLAPELDSNFETVRRLRENGVVVSAGHSMATFEQAIAAFAAGVSSGTHLFNAMPPLHHREPGLIGALMQAPEVTVGLIPDGVHVHPALVELVWRQCGAERIAVVTDGMGALGEPAGAYQLNDQTVIVDHESARLADGTLAGSILRLDQAVRNMVEMTGSSLSDILPTVTTTPATLLNIGEQKGQIKAGFDADLLFLSSTFHVQATLVAGQLVYQQE